MKYYEITVPNDSIGDFAFEWDIDGKERAKWNKYTAELERLGVRGELVTYKWSVKENPLLDSNEKDEYPLASYKLILMDFENNLK